MNVLERAIRPLQWLSKTGQPAEGRRDEGKLDGLRVTIFTLVHAAAAATLFVTPSLFALILAAALFVTRMFFVTAFYHRYFAHRAFKASRAMQFLMAFLGCTAGQRGPLWWAGYHRLHHATADTPRDPHSPKQRGTLFSHMLWFLTRGRFAVQQDRVRDWLQYPELRWLERWDWLPFVLLGAGCFLLGERLAVTAPHLNVSGAQLLVWGFFVSTVCLYHATYSVNSLCHRFGTRPFNTRDESRNNLWVALLTLGEGWHNNHHYYPAAARMGFAPREIDLSYLGLRAMQWLGLVRDLKSVPKSVMDQARRGGAAR